MPIAVSDSSVLILYAKIGRLDILRNLYSEVFIPPAVFREVTANEARLPGADSVVRSRWIQTRQLFPNPTPIDFEGLGRGETEAIQLILQLGRSPQVLLDDQRARTAAKALHLHSTGSAGILLRAKAIGYVTHVQPLIHDLQHAGLFISTSVVDEVIRLAGE
jgi:uncharacterized protein